MDIDKRYAVQMRGITKMFGNFCALDNVNLDIKKGSIHAILGENGAGKSTLMNVLYGLYTAEKGDIYLYGKKVDIKNPNVAIENGIGMVHQHFMLVENFTVTENIILGSEIVNGLGIIDKIKAKEKILEIIKKYGLDVDPDAKIEDISVGMQQRVEILKALYRGSEILILDEPTAVLTPQESIELIKTMKNLINDGKTVIIITHKLKEIKQSSDRCTIVRRGKYIDTVNISDVTETDLADMMVGRKVKLVVDKTVAKPKDVVFEIKNLVVKNTNGFNAVDNLSLSIRSGEIVGIAGIDGNGQSELAEAIVGLLKIESGIIKINGEEIQKCKTRDIFNKGISIIHEDRHKRGLVLDFTIAENMILEKYKSPGFSKKGVINRKAEYDYTAKIVEEYDVRPQHCAQLPSRALSGGNQQKAIIGREVNNNPTLLIAAQPTRGIDAGAIENIHKILIRERDKGKAILLISFDLDEVMNVSDTIAVIYAGKIVKTFKQGEVDEQTIGLYMAGGGQ